MVRPHITKQTSQGGKTQSDLTYPSGPRPVYNIFFPPPSLFFSSIIYFALLPSQLIIHPHTFYIFVSSQHICAFPSLIRFLFRFVSSSPQRCYCCCCCCCCFLFYLSSSYLALLDCGRSPLYLLPYVHL